MNHLPNTTDFPGYRDWLAVVRTYNECERVLTERVRESGLTLAQHEILATLTASGPLRQHDLADRLFVVKSNVTAMLSRMERDGLVERAADPTDGRAKRVALTAEGKRRVLQTLQAQREIVSRMFEALTAEESAQLGDVMRRAREAL